MDFITRHESLGVILASSADSFTAWPGCQLHKRKSPIKVFVTEGGTGKWPTDFEHVTKMQSSHWLLDLISLVDVVRAKSNFTVVFTGTLYFMNSMKRQVS